MTNHLFWTGIAAVPLIAWIISNEIKARKVRKRKPITSFTVHPESVPIPTSTFFEILQWLPRMFAVDNPVYLVKEKGAISRMSFLGLPMIELGGTEALDFLSACERQKLLVQNWPPSVVSYLGNVAAVKDGMESTHHRNLISGPFKQPLLGSYAPQIEEITRVLVGREIVKGTVNTVDIAKRITISIMLGCIFGIKNITSKEFQSELAEWRVHFDKYQAGLFSIPIDLPFTAFHKGKISKEWLKQKSIALMKEQVLQWEQSGRKPELETFFVQLYNSKDTNGRPLDESTIGDQGVLMLFAGHDTTASTIISAISLLHDNPEALDSVRQESFNLFGNDAGKPVEYSDLNKLIYLDAAIKESIRSRAAVGRVLKRSTADLTFDGYHIPANSILAFNLSGSGYYYGSDFAAPSDFVPERFLQAGSHSEKATVDTYDTNYSFASPAFQPFGYGKHACIGKPLAQMELKVVISTFVRMVDYKKETPHTEFTYFPIAYPKEEMREFTWKTAPTNDIDVAKLVVDHFQGKRVQPFPLQYDSEYKTQYGYKGIPEVDTMARLDTASQVGLYQQQTVDKNVKFNENHKTRIPSPVKQAWGEKSEIKQPAGLISPTKTDVDRPGSPSKESGRLSPTKIPTRSASPSKSETFAKEKDTEKPSPEAKPVITDQKSVSSPTSERPESKNNNASPTSIEKPIMSASFGIGNTNPTVPKNYLKTFNVKAPPSQVFAHTKERGIRIREFDENELRPVQKKAPADFPDPKIALKQYINARDLVKTIQLRYKTEYERQFLNWNLPFAKIKEQLAEQMPIDKERELKPIEPHTSANQKLRHQENKRKKGSEKEPLDFTKVQSIYHNLNKPPAGTESSSIKDHEKRHYAVEGKTWGLANELFERASSRASNKFNA
ncbi:hypothetical protein HDV01_002776 [Terramyces sp. JEL0728]|nr:hypothetical protein HDV01_002776 [Terramyces sp. JEL0728]